MSTPLSIDLIRTDGDTQARVELNQEVVDDYCEKWLLGVEFEAIDVYHDGANYWPSDGFHRLFGAIKAKRSSITANVRRGTQRDAILAATAANATHGLPRTNADKRKAVTTLLSDKEWVEWSDRKIAEQVHVSVPTVSSIRDQLSKIDSSSPAAQHAGSPRVGKDGKKRKPPKRSTPSSNGKPKKSKPGKGKSPAKFADELSRKYVSHLVRGIDKLAEMNGGKGDAYDEADSALNSFIGALKKMREGKQ